MIHPRCLNWPVAASLLMMACHVELGFGQGRPILLKTSLSDSIDYEKGDPALEEFCCSEPRFFVAMGELLALQVIPNYFNGNIIDDSTASIGLEHWFHNMNDGFEWDNNTFTNNMFMHPYHGSVFFNTGRSNGYDFWSSAFFAAGGSFLWEMYGENNLGAINDWIATSLGGIMIGEALHRTAMLIRDNEARGASRSLREFGALLVDPVGGINRIMRGEASRTGPNPPDRTPNSNMIQVTTGFRSLHGDSPADFKRGVDVLRSDDFHPYVDVTVQYGDWFRNYDTPFASFQLAAQLNLGDDIGIGEFTTDGTLWGTNLKEDENSMHTIAANQRFTYIENPALAFGGPFFGFTLNSHLRPSERLRIDTRLQPMFAIMTGVDADYDHETGRDYDFGTGLAANISSTLYVSDFPVLRLAYFGVYTETVNGVNGYHLIHSPSLNLRYKLYRGFGVGIDLIHWIRDSTYEDFPDVYRSLPTIRVNLNVSLLDRLSW